MSLYLGNNLIAPNQSNAANKSLSNLDATGQAVIDNKADVDFINITDTAKIVMSNIGMPSNSYVNLTLGASGSSYVAPANGWVVAYKFVGDIEGYQYFNLQTDGATDDTVKIQDSRLLPGRCLLTCTIPVLKGETFYTVYNATGRLVFFRFYYAVGSESEAQ